MANETDITSIDKQIRPLLDSDNLHRYELLTKELLRRYAEYPRVVNFMSRKTDVAKERIIEDYMICAILMCPKSAVKDVMISYLTEKRKNTNITETKCPECGSENIENDLCLCCGYEINFVSEELAYRDGITSTMTRTPIYERTKHFRELLSQYQGKPTRQIDPEIIEQLRSCFLKNGIEPQTVTKRNIITFLQEIGHPELYECVSYLESLMTGSVPPNLSDVEEVLVREFEQLQKVFNTLTTEEKQGLTSSFL